MENDLDIIIRKIQDEIEQRRFLFDRMKSIYSEEKDTSGTSFFKYFLNKDPELIRLDMGDIISYEQRMNVKLPQIIVRILTEIGSGVYLNHTFFNNKKELIAPIVCLEDSFLEKCIEEKISPYFIDNSIMHIYDFETNTFQDEKIQSIYKSLGSDRDKHMAVLYDCGYHDSYIVLNREGEMRPAVYDVTGYSNKTFTVDGIEYESPYYKCMDEGHINTLVLEQINTYYWKHMLKEIEEMNSK